jgi:HEAT repeat-containing protein 5
MVQQLGPAWLERYLTVVLQHLLDLAAQPRAAPTHVDAVYSRQCIAFVLRSLLGKMLGEKQQCAACKELATIIHKHMNSIDPNPENAKDSSTQETVFSQHLLVCALQELGSLVKSLGSSASALLADQGAGVIDCAIAVLLHPSQAARLAAAWSLQSMATAVPCHLTLLIDKYLMIYLMICSPVDSLPSRVYFLDRCVDALENLRSTPEAVAGYSAALAALIGGVSTSPLGIPHNRGKIVFNTAEELLRSASQNNRLAIQRTQAGWLLIGAVMTLGNDCSNFLWVRYLI